jgi:hypothetical protein
LILDRIEYCLSIDSAMDPYEEEHGEWLELCKVAGNLKLTGQ